jgi:hypothetical protein
MGTTSESADTTHDSDAAMISVDRRRIVVDFDAFCVFLGSGSCLKSLSFAAINKRYLYH